MKKQLITWILLQFLTVYPASLTAEESPVSSVNVVFSDTVAPFVYRENNEITGVDVAIIRRVMSSIGIDVNFTQLPWPRAIRSVQAGEVDGAISMYCHHTIEGFKIIDIPTYSTKMSLFVKSDSAMTPSSLLETSEVKSINYMSGAVVDPYLSQYPALSKVDVSNLESQVKQLISGRVDIAFSEALWFENQAQVMGNTRDVKILSDLGSEPVCLAFSEEFFKKHPQIISDIEVKVKTMKSGGEIEEIAKTFMSIRQASNIIF